MGTLLQTNSGNDPTAITASLDALPLTTSPATQLPSAISLRKSWPAVEWLPMQLSVALTIPRFRVRDLLALDPGQTIATEWPNGDDLPLSIEDVQLAWIEMEAVDHDMAVRITRLL
ncbi:MAG: FliM/FliN family flagellar motor C-terminal domain-containing protein [Acidobacteriaceae bacterium]